MVKNSFQVLSWTSHVQGKNPVVALPCAHQGILSQALEEVRQSGFGGLHYPHDQVCEKDHSSAVSERRALASN